MTTWQMYWMNNGTNSPSLVHTLANEHTARSSTFHALRQMGAQHTSTVQVGVHRRARRQGVQQLHVDAERRLYSCGADCSLKLRPLPTVFNETV